MGASGQLGKKGSGREPPQLPTFWQRCPSGIRHTLAYRFSVRGEGEIEEVKGKGLGVGCGNSWREGRVKVTSLPWIEQSLGAAGPPVALLSASPVAGARRAHKHASEYHPNWPNGPYGPQPLPRRKKLVYRRGGSQDAAVCLWEQLWKPEKW